VFEREKENHQLGGSLGGGFVITREITNIPGQRKSREKGH